MGACMKAIFVSAFEPAAVGHGGNHRAYQVAHDLEQAVGTDELTVVSLPRWYQSSSAEQLPTSPLSKDSSRPPASPQERKMRTQRIRFKLGRLLPLVHVDRRVALLDRARGTADLHLSVKFMEFYEQLAREIGKPAVCVIEHVGFAPLLAINSRYGIATVSCVANIEAFDQAALAGQFQQGKVYSTAIDFAREVGVLARCDARLFISKVEAGLIGGLGLPSEYYPYLPVGAIRQNLDGIRQIRARDRSTPGLFLMLGTAEHTTTRASFSWFVQCVRDNGLPRGTRVVVCGSRTDKLLPSDISVAGLDLRGWVDQDHLDELLTRVQAVLVPQLTGFGSLTRLPELACAGIPVIASTHATHAVDPTPGLHVADPAWDAWCSAMAQLANSEGQVSHSHYLAWEEKQANPLRTLVSEMARNLHSNDHATCTARDGAVSDNGE